jgi:hypothetical protein
MDRPLLYLTAGPLLLAACGRAKQEAKEALNTGGELAGKAASEVIDGVTTGVEKTWSVEVALSPALSQRGFALGKTSVETDSLGKANLVVLYLTNSAAVDDTLHVKAFGKDSLEMGRALLPIKAGAGTGAYYEVRFPARTDLGRKDRVIVE